MWREESEKLHLRPRCDSRCFWRWSYSLESKGMLRQALLCGPCSHLRSDRNLDVTHNYLPRVSYFVFCSIS
jgi:hypothetical protein